MGKLDLRDQQGQREPRGVRAIAQHQHFATAFRQSPRDQRPQFSPTADDPTGTNGANGGPLQHFGSKFTTDIDVSYDLSDEFTVTVGANNVFNTFPDKLNNNSIGLFPITGGSADGQVYPRNGGPFGMNGGFWYARLTMKY